jgi:hypothetical protein
MKPALRRLRQDRESLAGHELKDNPAEDIYDAGVFEHICVHEVVPSDRRGRWRGINQRGTGWVENVGSCHRLVKGAQVWAECRLSCAIARGVPKVFQVFGELRGSIAG